MSCKRDKFDPQLAGDSIVCSLLHTQQKGIRARFSPRHHPQLSRTWDRASSLVGLHGTIVFFAVRDAASITTFEIEIIVALQADCRIQNSFFYSFLSSIINFQKLVQSLIFKGSFRLIQGGYSLARTN
jgi:hypothetical protein